MSRLVILMAAVCSSALAIEIHWIDPSPIVVNREQSVQCEWAYTVKTPRTYDAAISTSIAPDSLAGALSVHIEKGKQCGWITVSVPADAPFGNYSMIVNASLDGNPANTSALSIRVNRPPIPNDTRPVIPITMYEDDTVPNLTDMVLFSGDDGSVASTFSCSQLPDPHVVSISAVPIYKTSALVVLTTTPHAFTASDQPILATLTATDPYGLSTTVNLTITVINTNDAPEVRLASTAPTSLLTCDPNGQFVQVGNDIDLVETLDPDETLASRGSTAMRWRIAVDDDDDPSLLGGIDGGDLLQPRAPDASWQITGNQIQRMQGGTFTTVATWSRPDGRSDHILVALTGTPNVDDAKAVLGTVHYAWMLGVPPTGSPQVHRYIAIACDEPHSFTAAGWDAGPYGTRPLDLISGNQPPSITIPLLYVSPLGRSPIALSLTDDVVDPSRTSVRFHGQALAGHIENTAGTAVSLCSFADIQAGTIWYRNDAADVTTDRMVVTVSDGDPRGPLEASADLGIRIAMPNHRFALLSDPLLTAERTTTVHWPLRFSHSVTTAPTLAAYPGLSAPPPGACSVTGDATSGWALTIDWAAVPVDTRFLGIVIHAQTTDPTATEGIDASQAMLIRIQPEAPHASN